MNSLVQHYPIETRSRVPNTHFPLTTHRQNATNEFIIPLYSNQGTTSHTQLMPVVPTNLHQNVNSQSNYKSIIPTNPTLNSNSHSNHSPFIPTNPIQYVNSRMGHMHIKSSGTLPSANYRRNFEIVTSPTAIGTANSKFSQSTNAIKTTSSHFISSPNSTKTDLYQSIPFSNHVPTTTTGSHPNPTTFHAAIHRTNSGMTFKHNPLAEFTQGIESQGKQPITVSTKSKQTTNAHTKVITSNNHVPITIALANSQPTSQTNNIQNTNSLIKTKSITSSNTIHFGNDHILSQNKVHNDVMPHSPSTPTNQHKRVKSHTNSHHNHPQQHTGIGKVGSKSLITHLVLVSIHIFLILFNFFQLRTIHVT